MRYIKVFLRAFVLTVLLTSASGAHEWGYGWGGGWPLIGLQAERITAETARELGVAGSGGILVREVIERSPAHRAGLRSGDVIVRLNDRRITGPEGFAWDISEYIISRGMEIELERGGRNLVVFLTLGQGDRKIGTRKNRKDRDIGKYGKKRAERGHRDLSSAILNELNLAVDQKKILSPMLLQYRKEMIRAGAEVQVAELELRELVSADEVDLALVGAKVKEVEAKRGELRLSGFEFFERVKKELNYKQRAKLQELILYDRNHWYGTGPGRQD